MNKKELSKFSKSELIDMLLKAQKQFTFLNSLVDPKWSQVLRHSDTQDKIEAFEIAMNGILRTKGGNISKVGQEFIDLLNNETKFWGFCPNTTYFKANEDNTLYIHPWGNNTLVFKHKKYPCLIVTNGALRADKSALEEISLNKEFRKAFQLIGLTG